LALVRHPQIGPPRLPCVCLYTLYQRGPSQRKEKAPSWILEVYAEDVTRVSRVSEWLYSPRCLKFAAIEEKGQALGPVLVAVNKIN